MAGGGRFFYIRQAAQNVPVVRTPGLEKVQYLEAKIFHNHYNFSIKRLEILFCHIRQHFLLLRNFQSLLRHVITFS